MVSSCNISSWFPAAIFHHGFQLRISVAIWDIRPKRNSRDISYEHNLLLSCQIVLKFCTEHGSEIIVLCAKFQNELTTEMVVIKERDLARLEFKMCFGGYPGCMDCNSPLYNRIYFFQRE